MRFLPKIPKNWRKSLPNWRPRCARPPKNSSSSGLRNCVTKRESCARKCCRIAPQRDLTMRTIVFVFLFAANVFGQAATGNEKYDQKQYADAANAYEKIPALQRDAGINNRLGISYHLSNQLKAAETAYRAALRIQPDSADVLSNVAALYYSQRKFSDAERQFRRAIEKAPENGVLRLNLRAARFARENAKVARDTAAGLANQNPLLVEKRE